MFQENIDEAIEQLVSLRQFRRGSFTEANLVLMALLYLSQGDAENSSSLDPVTGTRQQAMLEALVNPAVVLDPEPALTSAPSSTSGRNCLSYTTTLAQVVVTSLTSPCVIALQGTLWDSGSHYGSLSEIEIEENGVYFINVDAPLTRVRGRLESGSANVVFRFAFSRYN